MSGLGWRYRFRGLYLETSYRLGLPVRCFGNNAKTPTVPCPGRRWVPWDPIVGAYCAECWNAMIGQTRISSVPWTPSVDVPELPW